MSLQTASAAQRLTGDAGKVPGMSLTLNNSLVLGFNCAPLSMGKSNTFLGYGAAQNTREGNFNTILGFHSGQNCGGDENVYVGCGAAQNAMPASRNLVIGAFAGTVLSSGSDNVLLGRDANTQTYSDTFNVAVGRGARAGTTQSVSLGAGATVYGRQSIAIGHNVTVVGDGNFNVGGRMRGYWSTTSSSNVPLDTYAVQVDADLLKVTGALAVCQPGACNAHPQWVASLDTTHALGGTQLFADLVLRSANNAIVRFTDEFHPGIFDFTGQHRCDFAGSATGCIGCIVVSTGRYRDMQGTSAVRIDEAVPQVELCTRPNDPRVFGVVSAFETPGASHRDFRIGNMSFQTPQADARVVVNAVGEGAIWVCDANGPLKNGDLIASSHVPGMGMRQCGTAVTNCTAAKITCNCDFEGDVPTPVERVEHKGVSYRRALVGCTYKF